MRNIVLFMTFILVAPGMLAQSTVSFEPADPTSTTPVTLIVTEVDSCPPAPVLTRSGSTITVALGVGPCLSPPMEITHRLEVGPLPAGTYSVIVTDGGVQVATATLTVLDANDSVVVRPSIGTIAGGDTVEIIANVAGTPAITFGGVAATNVVVLGTSRFRATTPPHAAGAVEVRVGDRKSYAVRYDDPATPPLPALFERILVPVVYNGPGAYGSSWATEVSVRNDNPTGVRLWTQSVIAASRPAILELDDAPGGLFLIVARGDAPALHLNALVRDVSREALDWGTEMPIVRASSFSTHAIELLNIPVDARYRHTLRIYANGSYPTFARVSSYAMDDGRGLAERLIALTSSRPCSATEPCASDRPSFAMVSDFPGMFHTNVTTGRIGLRIETWVAGTPLWAMVTVTNNETQHVTVVSPQ
jgi:hypothetical protein